MAEGDNSHRRERWDAGLVSFGGQDYPVTAGDTSFPGPVGVHAYLLEDTRYVVFWEKGEKQTILQTQLESVYNRAIKNRVVIAELTTGSGTDYVEGNNVQLDVKADGQASELTATSFSDTIAFFSRLGTAVAPSHSFVGDTNTGMYSSGADNVNFATGGVLRLGVTSVGVQVTPTSTGTAEAARAAPVYSFSGDTDTGMYRHVSYGDLLGFSVGAAGFSVQERQASTGTYYLSLYAEGANDGTVGDPFFNIGSYVSEPAGTAYQPYPIHTIDCNYYYAAIDGGVGNPPFTRWTDGDTGMYFPTANGLGLTAGGIGILNIWSAAGTPNTGGAYPPTTGLFDLGHPSYKWKDVYVEISNVSGAGDNVNVTTGGLLVRDSSSIRYKTNIKPLALDTSKLSKLRPVSFDYIYDNASNIGLIAEEVNEVLPELVNYNTEGQPESIRFNGLTVMLLEKVKELENEIQKLKEKD